MFKFSLPHERNVDAVSGSYGYKWYKPSNQWWHSLQEHSSNVTVFKHQHSLTLAMISLRVRAVTVAVAVAAQ